MASTATKSAEELAQAYNQAISSSFAVADAGFAQSTATVKIATDAVQTERVEYGKVVEQALGHVRSRGENITAVMQSFAAIPMNGAPAYTPEVKESVNKLIEGEMAFYQAWTKSWMDYLSGIEQRRGAAAKAMVESNAKVVECSQEAVRSAVKYGEAFVEWSQESANGMKS